FGHSSDDPTLPTGRGLLGSAVGREDGAGGVSSSLTAHLQPCEPFCYPVGGQHGADRPGGADDHVGGFTAQLVGHQLGDALGRGHPFGAGGGVGTTRREDDGPGGPVRHVPPGQVHRRCGGSVGGENGGGGHG